MDEKKRKLEDGSSRRTPPKLPSKKKSSAYEEICLFQGSKKTLATKQ